MFLQYSAVVSLREVYLLIKGRLRLRKYWQRYAISLLTGGSAENKKGKKGS